MSRFDNIFEYDNNLNGAGLKVGIVMARFNLPICEALLSSCVAELKRLGVADADMTIANVPGALEVPLVLQTMAQSGCFDALVALGAVIRGDTYHFDTDEQAEIRTQPKGSDCAQAAVEMANLQKALTQ